MSSSCTVQSVQIDATSTHAMESVGSNKNNNKPAVLTEAEENELIRFFIQASERNTGAGSGLASVPRHKLVDQARSYLTKADWHMDYALCLEQNNYLKMTKLQELINATQTANDKQTKVMKKLGFLQNNLLAQQEECEMLQKELQQVREERGAALLQIKLLEAQVHELKVQLQKQPPRLYYSYHVPHQAGASGSQQEAQNAAIVHDGDTSMATNTNATPVLERKKNKNDSGGCHDEHSCCCQEECVLLKKEIEELRANHRQQLDQMNQKIESMEVTTEGRIAEAVHRLSGELRHFKHHVQQQQKR